MLLHFSQLASDGDVYHQSFYSPDFERVVETLNFLTSSGYLILSANLIDEGGKRTSLPLEAFDGEPIGIHIKKLESEYQKLLSP